ncbi:hypothetical protein ACIPYS_06620 [Kitasatospora sp. NPDC089913]|uniref:hypothetical protein n=1 Tax=Streptomycetaceae TaxID=2062 RepID=UPI00087BBEE0|nr:hypothetical protein [Streptomyces sp. TLI_053]SDT82486.1 hypothetical protein SAMN05216371_7271 [Streptomyces sp. TLI_053]
MKIGKRVVLVGTLSAVALLGVSGRAMAWDPSMEGNNLCNTGEICISEDLNNSGCMKDTYYSASTWLNARWSTDGLNCYLETSGATLYNGTDGSPRNATWARNFDAAKTVRIYYNSNHSGPSFQLRPAGQAGSEANFFNFTLSNGMNANDRMNSHKFGA